MIMPEIVTDGFINEKKKRIIIESDDPDTIFSYGLQTRLLINSLKKKYRFHVISSQYGFGKPHLRDEWVRWASEGPKRDTKVLPAVITQVAPYMIFTLGDLQHFQYVSARKPPQIPWVAWFPWDNHDVAALANFVHIMQRINVMVTISKYSYEFLTTRGIPVHEQIYNIVDTDSFKPMPKKEIDFFYERNPQLADKKVLLFVGRPNWRKRIPHIFAIFDRICRERDDVVLYMHCNFQDGSSENDLREVKHCFPDIYGKVAITEQQKWMLGVESDFLNKLYNICDIYITPHGGEGFGLPIAEAMACEKPFIATDCTTTPEFAGKDEERGIPIPIAMNIMQKNVMRPYADIKEFTRRTIELLDDDDRRKEMGKKGREWVLKECSKPVIIKKFDKLFASLDTPKCHIDYEELVKFKDDLNARHNMGK